eukprot:4015398-Amphidinium_carterae.1
MVAEHTTKTSSTRKRAIRRKLSGQKIQSWRNKTSNFFYYVYKHLTLVVHPPRLATTTARTICTQSTASIMFLPTTHPNKGEPRTPFRFEGNNKSDNIIWV